MKTRETSGGAQAYANAHRRRNKRRATVICMAALVVFCTVYAQAMPAATLDGDTYCGDTEHTHTEECYESVLSCELEEGEEHTHDESCYEDVLTCGLTEHAHAAECYVNPEGAESADTETDDTAEEILSTETDVEAVESSGVSTLAVGDEYQLSCTANYNTSSRPDQSGSTVSVYRNFKIIIVDGSGNAIDLGNVTFNTSVSGASRSDNTYTISYTQTSSSGYYSLSSLASYFTVEVGGTTYVYSGAKVGSSGANYASFASRIRYYNSNWQYGVAGTGGGGGQNQSVNYSNTSATEIYLVYTDPSNINVSTTISGTSFDHIDVKTAAAYTGDESLGDVTAIYGNQLTYTTTRTQGSQTTTVTNTVNLTAGDNEWTHNNSGNFTSTTTITITFSLDATSSTDQNATWYTSTITADTVYPDNTYYPTDGDEAYKLYNYVYGANLADGDPVPTDIDISGMSVFLVSAIVCNGSTVSGQGNLSGTNGLDLVLNVATLLSASPNFDFAVQKTLNGSASLTEDQFSFTFQKAEVDTNNNTWTIVSGTTGADNQTLKTETETATENGATSITQTIGGEQVTYSTRNSQGIETEYYILQEVEGSDPSVTYDSTVYGIAVTLTTTASSSTTGIAGTTYTTAITSVAVYKLTASLGSDGTTTYTVQGSALTGGTDYSVSNGEYIFPFTNTMTSTGSLTISKEVSGVAVTNKEYTFIISTTEDMSNATPKIGDASVTFSSGTSDGQTIYTATVTVSVGDGEDGSITITGLPLGSYTVTEDTANVDIDGYRFDGVTYQVGDDSSKTDKADVTLSTDSSDSTTETVKVTNTYTQVVDITVTKVDAQNTGTKLSGAKFYLTKTVTDGSGSSTQYYAYADGVVTWVDSEKDATPFTSSSDEGDYGTFTIYGLEDGTYSLVEVTAPDGYQLPSSDFCFTVTGGKVSNVSSGDASQSNTITITNTPGQILPETGGAGTTLMTISGLLIMAAAVVGGYVLRLRYGR